MSWQTVVLLVVVSLFAASLIISIASMLTIRFVEAIVRLLRRCFRWQR
jgi:hypothetical protein